MQVNQLLNNNTHNQNHNLPKTAEEKAQNKNTTLASDNMDKFDANSVNVNRNYQNAPDRAEFINVQGYRGRSALQMKNAIVADFVSHNVSQQGSQGRRGGINDILSMTFTPKAFALDAYNAAEATSAKHDDYWGVEAVAERIFTFARGLAGDNDELFETMKNAFLKGFGLAEKSFRGKLPDISYQTKARVLEYFDEWEAEINSRKAPVTEPPAAPVAEVPETPADTDIIAED